MKDSEFYPLLYSILTCEYTGSLNLSNKNIDDIQANFLAQALATNPLIKIVDLSQNPITEQSAKQLLALPQTVILPGHLTHLSPQVDKTEERKEKSEENASLPPLSGETKQRIEHKMKKEEAAQHHNPYNAIDTLLSQLSIQYKKNDKLKKRLVSHNKSGCFSAKLDKINLAQKELCDHIEQIISQCSVDLKKYKPKHIVNLICALALVNKGDAQLLKAIEQHIMAHIAEYNPQSLIRIAWAFSTLKVLPEELFKKIDHGLALAAPRISWKNKQKVVVCFKNVGYSKPLCMLEKFLVVSHSSLAMKEEFKLDEKVIEYIGYLTGQWQAQSKTQAESLGSVQTQFVHQLSLTPIAATEKSDKGIALLFLAPLQVENPTSPIKLAEAAKSTGAVENPNTPIKRTEAVKVTEAVENPTTPIKRTEAAKSTEVVRKSC